MKDFINSLNDECYTKNKKSEPLKLKKQQPGDEQIERVTTNLV